MTSRASIEDLSWMAGTWRGTVDGDVVEETWGEPLGPTLVGHFRWLKGDGEPYLYEILLVEEAEDGLWLRLRHFSAGLGAWPSEADGSMAWRLGTCEGRRAVFENEALPFPRRMVYHRTSEDTLVARLEGERDGEAAAMEFRFQRR